MIQQNQQVILQTRQRIQQIPNQQIQQKKQIQKQRQQRLLQPQVRHHVRHHLHLVKIVQEYQGNVQQEQISVVIAKIIVQQGIDSQDVRIQPVKEIHKINVQLKINIVIVRLMNVQSLYY